MAKSNCGDDEFCSQHSGMKVMVWVILFGVLGNLGLLSYNTFGVTASLKTDVAQAVAKLEGKVSLLEKSDEFCVQNINDLKTRVNKLEGGK